MRPESESNYLRLQAILATLYRTRIHARGEGGVGVRRVLSLTNLCLFFVASFYLPVAEATELFPPGSHAKLSAGAGQTVSRGPTSMFYNPANLIFVKFIEPDVDVSFAQTTYTYLHPDGDALPDPGIAKSAKPVGTVGLGFRPIPSLSFGVAYFPTGLGQLSITEHMPIELAPNNYEYAVIEEKLTGYKVAAGAAFRLAFPITIGAALIRTSERNELRIYTPEDDEEAYIDALYGGAWNQYAVGLRSELFDRAVVMALSYRTAVTKTYDANSNIYDRSTGIDDYEIFQGVGYLPATIGFGAEVRFGIFGLFFDYVMEQWSAALGVTRRGYLHNYDADQYINTNNFVGGAKLWISPKHMLQIAGGMHGSNMGYGVPEEGASADATALLTKRQAKAPRLNLDEGENLLIRGMGYGDISAIPRIVASGGYRAKITGNGYFQLGAHYQTGSRAVPEGYNGEGTHSLKIMMGTVALAFGF